MKKVFFAVFFMYFGFLFYGEKTPVENLYHSRMKNGLEVFIAENHSVPLVYVEIAVKCGGYTQTEENAGLFHLYEHMMFKGNKLYKDAASVQKALSNMGVVSWNGATDIECVNYYFTVPSSKLKNALEFWNAAIRFPNIDERELENEKKVVLAEIQGYFSEPERIYTGAKAKAMFSDSTWKLDPSGNPDIVKNATAANLREIQKKFYIPNNAALFIGGDVNPEEAEILVNKIFGSWKKGANPFESGVQAHNKIIKEKKLLVMPYSKISPDMAQVLIEFRGPDAEFDRNDTYYADVLTSVLSEPMGLYKAVLETDPLLFIPDSNYVWSGYHTRRQCGTVSFGIFIQNPLSSTAERALYFYENLTQLLYQAAAQNSEESLKSSIQHMENNETFASQTSAALLSTIRFWWAVADTEYYYSYFDNLRKVSVLDLGAFIDKYIAGKNSIISVLVNPEVFEKTAAAYKEAGFSVIYEDNAFWWQK